jgi:hypothetical protein
VAVPDDQSLAEARYLLARYRRYLRNARWGDYAFDILSITGAASAAVLAGVEAPPWITVLVAGFSAATLIAQKLWNPGRRRVAAATACVRIEAAIRRYLALDVANRDQNARSRLAEELNGIAEADQQAWMDEQESKPVDGDAGGSARAG